MCSESISCLLYFIKAKSIQKQINFLRFTSYWTQISQGYTLALEQHMEYYQQLEIFRGRKTVEKYPTHNRKER